MPLRYDVLWDFGPLAFDNVVIVCPTISKRQSGNPTDNLQTSTGSSDSSWCTSLPQNYNSATNYTITGTSASVSGDTVTCSIQSVVLNAPA